MRATPKTLCCVALAAAPGCVRVVEGNGVSTVEQRDLPPFSSVTLENQLNVEVVMAQRSFATLACDENLLPVIRTEVQDFELVVSTRGMTELITPNPCSLLVEVTELDRLVLSGSGDLVARSGPFPALDVLVLSGSGGLSVADLAVARLDVDLSGSGDVVADGIAAEGLYVTHSGSGEVRLQGDGDSAWVDLSGSGDVNLASWPLTRANVRHEGSGDILLDARDEVTGSMSGSGDLIVEGGADVRVRNTGSGAIQER